MKPAVHRHYFVLILFVVYVSHRESFMKNLQDTGAFWWIHGVELETYWEKKYQTKLFQVKIDKLSPKPFQHLSVNQSPALLDKQTADCPIVITKLRVYNKCKYVNKSFFNGRTWELLKPHQKCQKQERTPTIIPHHQPPRVPPYNPQFTFPIIQPVLNLALIWVFKLSSCAQIYLVLRHRRDPFLDRHPPRGNLPNCVLKMFLW